METAARAGESTVESLLWVNPQLQKAKEASRTSGTRVAGATTKVPRSAMTCFFIIEYEFQENLQSIS